MQLLGDSSVEDPWKHCARRVTPHAKIPGATAAEGIGACARFQRFFEEWQELQRGAGKKPLYRSLRDFPLQIFFTRLTPWGRSGEKDRGGRAIYWGYAGRRRPESPKTPFLGTRFALNNIYTRFRVMKRMQEKNQTIDARPPRRGGGGESLNQEPLF